MEQEETVKEHFEKAWSQNRCQNQEDSMNQLRNNNLLIIFLTQTQRKTGRRKQAITNDKLLF